MGDTEIRHSPPPPPKKPTSWAWTSLWFACMLLCVWARPHVCTLRGRHVHYLFISPVCRAATLCISACLAIIMPHALFNARAGSDADSYTAIYLGYAHLLPCLVLSQTAANKCTGPSPAQTCIVFTSGHAAPPPPQDTHPYICLFWWGNSFGRNVGTDLFRRINLRKEWAGQLALTASRKNMSDHPVIVCFPLLNVAQ